MVANAIPREEMISKTLLLSAVGSSSVAGCILAVVLMNVEGITLVERYGVLGLLAAVILGIGGGILKLGWEQTKLLSKMNSKIDNINRKVEHIHDKVH